MVFLVLLGRLSSSLDVHRKTDLTHFLASPTAPETGKMKPDSGAFVNQVSAG